MINCEKTISMLSAYIDNELNKSDKLEIEKHLETCSNCKNELNELQQIISLIAETGNEGLPSTFSEELHNKLLEAADSDKKVKSFNLFKSKYIRVCSTIAAGLLVCFLLKDYFTGVLFGVNKSASSSDTRNMAMSEQAIAGSGSKESTVNDKSDYTGKNKAASENGAKDNSALADKFFAPEVKQDNSIIAYSDEIKNSDEALKKEIPERSTSDNNSSAASDITYGNLQDGESEGQSQLDRGEGIALTARAKEQYSITAYDKYQNQSQLIKNIAITITNNEIADSGTKIKDYAKANGAAVYERYQPDAASFELKKQPSSGLGIKIENSEYNRFIEFMNDTFGAAKINYGTMFIEDSADKINDLNSQINEVNLRIDQLKKQSNYDKNELNQMVKECEQLRIKLQNTVMDAGYVLIDIYFN